MIRSVHYPADQTASATSTDGTGSPGTDDAQADPITGTKRNVVVTIHSTLDDALGGVPSIRYTLNGSTYTNVRVGGTGSFTDTVSLGTLDLTNLAVQARATSGPGTSSDASVTSWTVTYDLPGIIADVG